MRYLLLALTTWAPGHLVRWSDLWRSDLLRAVQPDLALVSDTDW